MRTARVAALGLLGLVAAGPLAAQQPEHGAGAAPDRAQRHAQMERSDRLLEERLAAVDTLKGDAKVDALAAVVKELVVQRRAMHERMSEGMKERMSERMKEMMGPRCDTAGRSAEMGGKKRPGT